MASKDHCKHCFDSLLKAFDHQIQANPEFEDLEYPLFVTWYISQDGEYQLRGCIGTFQSQSLHQGLQQYARISAFKDSRFSPIEIAEIERLQVSVNLLIDFEQCSDWNDWEIGTHGIEIRFMDGNARRSATFLPQVAAEQGWTRDETLRYLLRKAGYHDRVELIRDKMTIVRYKSSISKMTFQEYKSLINA